MSFDIYYINAMIPLFADRRHDRMEKQNMAVKPNAIASSCTTSYEANEDSASEVVITLTGTPLGSDGLRFRFSTGLSQIDHANDKRFVEATEIFVLELVAKCTHIAPKGFLVTNGGMSLVVFYTAEAPGSLKHRSSRNEVYGALAASATRLRERVNEVCSERNMAYRQDPQTMFVTARAL